MRESGIVEVFLRAIVERRMSVASRKDVLEAMSIFLGVEVEVDILADDDGGFVGDARRVDRKILARGRDGGIL